MLMISVAADSATPATSQRQTSDAAFVEATKTADAVGQFARTALLADTAAWTVVSDLLACGATRTDPAYMAARTEAGHATAVAALADAVRDWAQARAAVAEADTQMAVWSELAGMSPNDILAQAIGTTTETER